MNNNDMNIAIQFAVKDGSVVVKEVNGIAQSTERATKSFRQLDAAGNDTARGLGKAATGSKQFSGNLSETQSRAAGLRNELGSLIGITAGLYTGFQAFKGVKEIANIAAEFNGLQTRIQTATRETRDYNQVSAEIYAIAQKNGVALQSSVDLFQRMATSRKDLKATNSAMLQLNDAVQMLGVLGGASTQALDNGLGQFSQGLSAGIFRAEEWNSLLENVPDIAARIGRGMDDIGKSTKELGFGEMRKLVNEGKLLSQDVLQSILVQLPEIRAEFDELPISMSRAGVMFDNSFSAAISNLDKTVGLTNAWAQSLVGVSQVLDSISTGELDNLSPRLQASIKTAELLAYVVGTIGVVALLKYAKAQYAVMLETLLANTASIKQVSTLGMVTTTAGTATVATNALAMAQRALLGPLGLVIGVAGVLTAAWFTYESQAEKVQKQNEDLAKSFERMSNPRKAGLYKESLEELQQVEAKIAEINTKLKSASSKKAVPNNGFGVGDVGASVTIASFPELGELKKRQAELNAVIEGINKNINAGVPALEDYSDKLTDNSASVSQLKEEMLKLYNAQMLAATAVDAQGRALNGIDLELFKAQFVAATELPANAAEAIKKFALDAKAATANLTADEQLQQLRTEVGLMDIKIQKGEREYEIKKALAQFSGKNSEGVDPKRLAALTKELQLLQHKQQLASDKQYLANLAKENELLKVRLMRGEKEYEIQKALAALKGTSPAKLKEIEEQLRLNQQLEKQVAVTEEVSSDAWRKMMDDMTALGSAGNDVGNILTQAFGRVGQQIEAMTNSQRKYAETLKEMALEKAKIDAMPGGLKRAAAEVKYQETLGRLQYENTQMQMGNYATLAGAASKMFSEQSKGRQVMHKLEVTFAAIETALALKKAAANAIAAITNQGSGDPYTAFARIAAMAAIMAGLGVFNGSTSGGGVSAEERQKTQGTGTVLGDSDAKSESIANVLGRIEDLELDQYAELRSINNSIRELSAGIKNLAVNLVASYGRFNESNYPGELGKDYNLQLGSNVAAFTTGGLVGVAVDKLLGGLVGNITNKLLGGLFGSKKTELLDSGISFASQQLGDILSSGLVNATVYDVIKTTKKKLFGLSKSSSENTEYRAMDDAVKAEFGRIFSHMGKSITEAVELLGLETGKSLEGFVINLPNLSFKDLSGDEIEKELQAMFSQQGDLMVQYLLPGIAEFQKMGEGLYDTLLRVAQEQAVFNSALDNLGHQLSRFSGVTKEMEVQIAQSIIEMMGGIEQFQSLTADYFAEFYSEAEQLAAATQSAQAQFASLGQTMPANREAFKAMVESLDLTTESGQQMYAALMALSPLMDQIFDDQERRAKELANFNKGIGDELAKLDMSDLERNLFDLKAWYDAQIKEAAELGADTTLLETLYARKRDALINDTFNTLVDAITQASQGIDNAIRDIRRSMDGWSETDYQNSQVNQLRSQLGSGDINAQIKNIQALQGAIVSRYQAEMAANNNLMQQAQSVLDNLNASWGELTSQLAGVRSAISSAILDLRRQSNGWNEVGYQSGQIGQLRGKLGAGSVLDQINVVGQLQQAIMDRYNAELAANQQMQSAAQERYEADVAAHNALRDAARQLLAAADALLLSDYSPALMGEQFKEAQKQFNSLLNRAKSGDTDAMQSLQSAGSSYLDLARDYFASGSSEYAAIFDEVQKAYRGFGGAANAAEPAVPRAVLQYQESDAQLQQQTIAELEALQTLLDELEKQALAEKTAAEEKAKAELAAYQAKQLELQLGAIAELTDLQTMLADLEAQAAAQRDAQLAAAQQQVDAIVALEDGFGEIVDAIRNIPPPVIIINPPAVPPTGTGNANASGTDNSAVVALLEQQLQQQQQANARQQRQMAAMQDDLQRTQAMLYENRRLA